MTITTGNRAFAVCPEICHVLNLGHTANVVFAVCRPKQHTAKKGTRHPCFFDVSQQRKHTVKVWHTANTCVCRVAKIKHSANTRFAVCLSGAHGKHVGKNLNLPSKIFLLDTYNVCYFILNFAAFHMKFAIFSTLVSLIEFLGDWTGSLLNIGI